MAKPATIDEYLAPLSADKRAALQKLRKIIREAVPGAEEGISYGIPAFRANGELFACIGAAANHIAIYGVGGTKEELADYDTSGKGTIRFQPEQPLPEALIRKLVKERVAKNTAKKR